MKDSIPIDHKFLQALQLLISSVRIHQDNNQILRYSVEQLVDITRQLIKGNDEVFLISTGGGFYLQEEKLQFRGHAAVFADVMLQFFEKRKLSGLKFNTLIFKAPVEEITAFARFLNQAAQHEDPPSWLENAIKENNLVWVEHVRVSQISLKGGQESGTVIAEDPSDQMEAPGDEATQDREQEQQEEPPVKNVSDIRKKNVLQTYGYAIMSLKEIAGKVSSNKKASIQKSIRLVQNMIDMIADDNQMFFGLSTIRDYDDYTYTHSLNVAILSICLGHRIGISKSLLEALSLSALFHDLGKIDVPLQILNKPGRLTDTEFQVMKKHSIDSVRRIIKLRTTRAKKAKIMLAPFEHHLKFDQSGYPRNPRNKPISLFGRIITIADVFDAITAPRIYRPVPMSPDRALGFMLENSGKDFDPILLRIFINMIGVYPVGTMLKLDNDEMGLVAKYTGESDQERELWVQLLVPLGEDTFEKGELINIGALNSKTGTFKRPIIESMHPSAFGIQPAEFII